MTADLINLRRARKAKLRAERETEAAENRAAFGRTREERERARAEAKRASAKLDAHQRKPDGA